MDLKKNHLGGPGTSFLAFYIIGEDQGNKKDHVMCNVYIAKVLHYLSFYINYIVLLNWVTNQVPTAITIKEAREERTRKL